jgi:hypothetical protein
MRVGRCVVSEERARCTIVRFELTPHGLGPVQLGTTREDARRALAAWGDCRPFRRTPAANEGWSVMRSSTTIFAYVDDGGRVEAIELASPGHGIAGGDQVVFDDVDLFIDEADVVIAKLEAKGVELTEGDDTCTTTAPDVLLGLWRDGDPSDETGRPLYFESALIARPGYYDQRRTADPREDSAILPE